MSTWVNSWCDWNQLRRVPFEVQQRRNCLRAACFRIFFRTWCLGCCRLVNDDRDEQTRNGHPPNKKKLPKVDLDWAYSPRAGLFLRKWPDSESKWAVGSLWNSISSLHVSTWFHIFLEFWNKIWMKWMEQFNYLNLTNRVNPTETKKRKNIVEFSFKSKISGCAQHLETRSNVLHIHPAQTPSPGRLKIRVII